MSKKRFLLVIDAQVGFVNGSLGSPEAQMKIPAIVNKIKSFDGDYIIATRDTHSEDYLNTKEGQKLPVVHCVKDTPDWEIESKVAEAITSRINDDSAVVGAIIDKPTFGSEELVNYIKSICKNDEAEIELVGFCTDICVVSNALLLKAALYETADLTVDASCCAGVTPESHIAALTTMKMCQINVVNE